MEALRSTLAFFQGGNTGFSQGLHTFGQGFYDLFYAGANFFLVYVLQLLPWIVIMITFMHIVFKLIGVERIEKLVQLTNKFFLTRWILSPVIAMVFSGNPMTYPYARFLPERQKVAFFDPGISFCHPVTGLFPHANPGEIFVWLGIASGVYIYGTNYGLGIESIGGLAIEYFLAGMVMVLLRSIFTQVIYDAKYKKKYGHYQGEEVKEQEA